MKTELIARIPILYRSKLYAPGEALPTDDLEMVVAWQEAQSAEYRRSETLDDTILQESEEKNIEESNKLVEEEDFENQVEEEDSDVEPDAPTEPEKESKKQDASRGKTKGRNNK